MLLHLSVRHSVHKGVGLHGRGSRCGKDRGACVAAGINGGGHAWQGGGRWWHVAGGHACVAGEAATAADATHHTGKHSCLLQALGHKNTNCFFFYWK